ncbi:hypothetical protein A152_0021850 [Vibrio tasmaniensis 1F-187]|uniref:hypothetical protein n=1 Tax=unclassified Vibrio TaxID=2614977 RepID=UPI00031C7933|nr:hypothetical protein [Vibrio tasmaniensis]OEF71910.1 hypothetical protein A152_13505 [Vibrio tasmaniensis 1F-187]
MSYLNNFFKRALPDDELFETPSDFSTVDMLTNSFFYHVKSEASDTELRKYKELARLADDPMDFIEQIKMTPVQSAIKELKLLKPTH